MNKKNCKRLILADAFNVRDIGGYQTVSGGTTKWNTFIRGEELQFLNKHDVSLLNEYGVKTVIDLRCFFEADKNVNFISENIIYKNIPLIHNYDNITGNFHFHMVDNCKDNIKQIFEYIGERIYMEAYYIIAFQAEIEPA